MRKRRPLFSIAAMATLLALLTMLLAACGSSGGGSGSGSTSSGPVTLNYWYTEGTSETPVILSLIQQFQQQNPNIKLMQRMCRLAMPSPSSRQQLRAAKPPTFFVLM